MNVGPQYLGGGRCEFVVWAPLLQKVELKITGARERTIAMTKDDWGYWRALAEDIQPGARYLYRLDQASERPDPASNSQPESVHAPSEVIDHAAFGWSDDAWQAMPLEQMIIYELHVGAFTAEGTFEAVIARLDDLCEAGINAIEIMPVAQFPGDRNWGYDGVYPFAPQNSYGGANGLKHLVNACHERGVAVILDVVYNHLGPEGNYLREFGPYFTEKYKTPWGSAINFDDEHSDGVRNFFIENTLYWLRHYHIDALRLDAVHGIVDLGAKHFLQEMAERVEALSSELGRKLYLIAESNLNDVRLIRPIAEGGYGLDAQWCDDFHHALRTLLTDERLGYYEDFGEVEQMAKALREGFVYSGQYSAFRKRRFGSSSESLPGSKLVVFSQNHDQIGNRMMGERLSQLIPFEGLKLAAGVVLASPYVPLLFMGEEYGDKSPFLYFISHSDEALVEAVRRGRKAEFESFKWQTEPPDPQSVETFLSSKLKWEDRARGKHKRLLEFYKQLIRLRRELPALAVLDKESLEVQVAEGERVILMHRWQGENHLLAVINFEKRASQASFTLPDGCWRKILDSAEEAWGGAGASLPREMSGEQSLAISPLGFALYERK